MDIEVRRTFRKEEGKARFRATYLVTDVPEPGCVQVTVTLATRIQLAQEIARQGLTYSESLLADCAKELVAVYAVTGGHLDPECSSEPSSDAIAIGYVDFDLLVAAARSLSRAD